MIYSAFGLSIRSDVPLPELPGGEGPADLTISVGRVDAALAGSAHQGRAFRVRQDGAYYFVEGMGTFLVRDGRVIIVDPIPGAGERSIRLGILGPALALALMQRGKLLLHASAVAVEGAALGFLGHHGAGKSTLAAALHARGHEMITDDLAVVEMEAGCPVMLPGFPYAKLWPDAVAALGDDVDGLPRLHPDFEKRFLPIRDGFCGRPVPLRGLYVLSTGPTLAVEPLDPQEGLEMLMRNWYGARFGDALLEAVGIPAFFLQCTTLAGAVPMWCLYRPPVLPMQNGIGDQLEDALLQALG